MDRKTDLSRCHTVQKWDAWLKKSVVHASSPSFCILPWRNAKPFHIRSVKGGVIPKSAGLTGDNGLASVADQVLRSSQTLQYNVIPDS